MIERSLPLQVIKIGGSLRDTASNRSALKNAVRWLARQTDAMNVVIVGGGRAVDHLRRWDRQFNLTGGQVHLNAVQVMSLNALEFARANCISTVIHNWNELTNITQNAGGNPITIVFDCLSFVRDVEPTLGGVTLASDWSCTSDSIAARITQLLGADKLTLLKSRTACNDNLRALSYANYVDLSFPQMAADIKSVTFVDCSP